MFMKAFSIFGKLHRWSLGIVLPAVKRRMNYFRRLLRIYRCEHRMEKLILAQTRQKIKSPKPVVHLYTLCWNEEKMLPWMLDHYSTIVDHFFIYDNGSTDSTTSLLAAHPNVTVLHHETGGKFDADVNTRMKNTVWKASIGKADFVIVCDVDELLWHPHPQELLMVMKAKGYTILRPFGYQMTSEIFPDFDGTCHITEIIKNGIPEFQNYSKAILFNPNAVDICYGPGAHKCWPTGNVQWYESRQAKLLHYSYVGREIQQKKFEQYIKRLSDKRLKAGKSRHYFQTQAQLMGRFDHLLKESKPVI
jgi:glycosyltransferase involved in cell wall biosynthesis